MKNYAQNFESGSVIKNILIVLALIITGVIIYVMTNQKQQELHQTTITSSQTTEIQKKFTDGLTGPAITTTKKLNDFDEGVSEITIYNVDINSDGIPDKITKTYNDTGNAHSYYQYKIELNQNGQFQDITPDDFRTVQGADCVLQQIQFSFSPEFQINKISRPWQDSWDTPTIATQTIYNLVSEKLRPTRQEKLKSVCDVETLF